MSTRRAVVLITLCLTLLTLASGSGRIGFLIPKAHAITIDKVTLGGDISGWNFTDGPVNNPPISVGQGDNVSLIMGADDVNHHFVFDADNDTKFTCPPDLCSHTIMYGYTPIQYSFTANFAPGTYKYYCLIHPLTMNGTFTIRPGHDVVVSKTSVSRNFA
jgi:plastocyanin